MNDFYDGFGDLVVVCALVESMFIAIQLDQDQVELLLRSF